ncbi:MAG: alanyl-tRNA editing protein [Candidatus Aenigmarchaeota archaeon]|nr:alanyl-tRNA editing protein [Candidatus Aenigmarchaeota archaeon]
MTELLHMKDCYLKEFNANVIRTGDDFVVLDRTAFYPEGGGQESDTGYLEFNGQKSVVTKVEKKGDVVHRVEKVPSVGTEVKGYIDWDKRYARMRMHTAQHLVSWVAMKLFGLTTVGNQIHGDKSRIDFYPAHFSEEDLKKLEEESNNFTDKGLEVRIYELPREEALKKVDQKRCDLSRLPSSVKKLRIVEINGIDLCPCAGTHVKNLKELGKIRILEKINKGKNKQRIVYELI